MILKTLFFDDLQESYQEDIIEKKKAGRGAVRSKRSFKHRLRSAADLMSPYERAKYRKAGEITVSNLYDAIISREEFEKLGPNEKKARLIRWRELYSNGEIQEKLGITSNATFHKLISELGLPRKRKGTTTKKAKTTVHNEMTLSPIPADQQQPVRLITKGMNLEYNGKYTAEDLNKIFTKLQLLVDGEENEFHVSINVSEIAK